MDREERLKAAKEKLKKFQKKKQGESLGDQGSTPDLEDVSTSKRSTPKNEALTETFEQPSLFTFESKNATESDPFVSVGASSVGGRSSVAEIQSILESSKIRRISDVADSEIEVLKARLSQLEKENRDLKNANSVQQEQIRQSQKEKDDSLEMQSKFEEQKAKMVENYEQKITEMKNQVTSHAESIEILVSDKRELETRLTSELEEIKGTWCKFIKWHFKNSKGNSAQSKITLFDTQFSSIFKYFSLLKSKLKDISCD